MASKLTLPAVIAVAGYSVLGIVQIFNLPLAILAIGGLVILLSDNRKLLGLLCGTGCLIVSYLLGAVMLMIEALVLVVLPALIITISIKANRQAVFTVTAAAIPMLILIAVLYLQVGDPVAYYDQIAPELTRDFTEMSQSLQLQDKLKLSDSDFESYQEMYLDIIKQLMRFLPALLLISITIIASAAYILTGRAFQREGRYLLKFPRLINWKLDERLLIIFGLALVAALSAHGLLLNLGENAALYIAFLLSLCGFSLIEFHMRQKKLGMFVRLAVYFCLMLFHIYSGILTAILGVIDSHFDFRKLRALRLG